MAKKTKTSNRKPSAAARAATIARGRAKGAVAAVARRIPWTRDENDPIALLEENLEHHIQEEEQQMFPTARAVMSREELDGLGARIRKMKATRRR